MELSQRLFELQQAVPFNRIPDVDLMLIADVAKERSFAPGEIICRGGESLRELYIVVAGNLRCGEREITGVYDIPRLLLDRNGVETTYAGPSGATCLSISRSHFYTIVREFPIILVDLLSHFGDGGHAN